MNNSTAIISPALDGIGVRGAEEADFRAGLAASENEAAAERVRVAARVAAEEADLRQLNLGGGKMPGRGGGATATAATGAGRSAPPRRRLRALR
jgi:hypothetical protein